MRAAGSPTREYLVFHQRYSIHDIAEPIVSEERSDLCSSFIVKEDRRPSARADFSKADLPMRKTMVACPQV